MIRRRPWPVHRRRRTPFSSALSWRFSRLGIAAVMAVGALALFFGQHAVRTVEAGLAAMLLGVAQVDAPRALGTNVLFPLRGALIGLDITASVGLARTGVPVLGLTLLALALVICGMLLVRAGMVRHGS